MKPSQSGFISGHSRSKLCREGHFSRCPNDILDISKIEAGKLELEIIPFNIRQLLGDVDSLLGARAIQKGLKFKIDVDPSVPEWLYGDPTRLRQVLINLAGNAVKFTASGGIRISSVFGDDEIKFSVIDTGIGIGEEQLPLLFADFAQADSSITRMYEGTGLGLAICRRLIGVMNGEISVESTLGKGSTFKFMIPAQEAQSEHDSSKEDIEIIDYKSVESLNILVAEDNEINQMVIEALMAKYGHETTIAADGVLAVEQFKNGAFDLILMDVRMPEMGGPDATRAIRSYSERGKKIPIIALTADAMTANLADYAAAGMDETVAKPIVPQHLMLAINRVMKRDVHVPA